MEEDTVGVFNDTIDSVDATPSSESEGFFSGPSGQSMTVNSSGNVDDLGVDFGNFASSTLLIEAIDHVSANSAAIHSCAIDQDDVPPDTTSPTNNFAMTDGMDLTENNPGLDTTDPVSTTLVDPENQSNDDELDDFAITSDTHAPSNDSLVHDDNDQVSPGTDLATTSEPVEAASFVENRDVRDALGVEMGELQLDGVGDFKTGESPAREENVESQVDDGDDDFGDFGEADPCHTTSNLDSVIDDDDFGDFGGTANSQSRTENVDPLVDDDDFGDFDEAPIAATTELTDSAFVGFNDPILDRLYVSFPKLFVPGSFEESSSDFDALSNLPKAAFTESDFVSIESCLGSFVMEDSATMSNHVMSYNPAHMLSALFASSGNEFIVPNKMSKYIVAKNLTISPLRCPVDGSLRGSSTRQQIRPRAPISSSWECERGALDPTDNHPVEEVLIAGSSNGSKLSSEPSETAKAFVARIPDLSYMLSSEFVPPSVVSASHIYE